MITQFRVQNYKALRDVTLDLTPVHVLIGPNDCGKTSLLEAMAALSRSVDRDISNALQGSWTGRQLVWYGASDPIVTFAAVLDGPENGEYALKVRFTSMTDRNCYVEDESVKSRNHDRTKFSSQPNSESFVARSTHRGLASTPEQRELALQIHNHLSGVHVYRWVPRYLALPNVPNAGRRFRMESSGFGLALCLDDILGFDPRRFIALEQRFKAIFPRIKSIKLLPESAYRAADDARDALMLQRVDGKGLHFEFEGTSQLVPASQVSDGVLLVLAYLAVLYLPEPPRLLLVEEPENGIHPRRLEEVLKILRELVAEQNRTQIVFTTHSPYVVSYFAPEEVTLCRRGTDGAVEVRRLSESKPVREQMNFFTLGEIWTGEGDDALMQPA